MTDALSIVLAKSALAAPAVDAVQPEVRSGVTFMFRDPLKRGVSAEDQDTVRANMDEQVNLASFVSQWSFDVPFKRADEFRAWLLANERNLARACPKDVRYLGTYAIAFGFENGGKYMSMWAYNSFQGFQNASQEIGDPDSIFAILVQELNSFRDRGRGAPEIQFVMTPAASAHRF